VLRPQRDSHRGEVTAVKPYYQENGITIYHGDCREVLASLTAVDVVITDPPYSEHVHGKSRRGGADDPLLSGDGKRYKCNYSRVKELGFAALDEETRNTVAAEIGRLVKRWVLTFSDVESSHLWRDALTQQGLDYVRTGAWVKLGATPQFTGDRPAAGFEAITIAHPRGKKRWNGGGSHALWQVPIVLNRSRNDPRLHTTQKPLALMSMLVSDFSEPGEVVLDPFCGSGTTLRASATLGRQAIGIDTDEGNCEVSAMRMQQQSLVLSY
jgi:DNA modification methylase